MKKMTTAIGFLLLATTAYAETPAKKPDKNVKAIVDDRKKTDAERAEEKRVRDALKVEKKIDAEGKI